MATRRSVLRSLLGNAVLAASMTLATLPVHAANPVLKIGFVGVTSGPAAAWGTSNVRSMQTRAAWLNELGGVTIGGTTYDIEIVTFDDQKDPKRAIAGMEKMAQAGIHYVSARTSMMALLRFVRSLNRTTSCIFRTPFQRRSIAHLPRMQS